ncbi:glutaminyl-peptide cyclotransferase [Candidatus Electronema sp. TJ]|uniref:glutaminyl-peptide cyclotransferase n=1 Tax=Candidatus Electronema sp. TJ TaxID=3401573 RepID=UPI003AA874B0
MELSCGRRMAAQLLTALFLAALPPVLKGCSREEPETVPAHFIGEAVKEYAHDQNAFTQGLAWDKGEMYESTGLNGYSSLRRVDLESGRVEQRLEHSRDIFAEGLTVLKNSIYQLTWDNRLIFQYDKRSFELVRTWPWPREGWGITHDGRSLIVSDGSSTLYFLDPESMNEQRRLTVRDQGREIDRLNELEYVKGSVYANVWKETRIAIISPESGAVTSWLDLSEISAQMRQPGKGDEDVLNGIMHDPAADRLFVTGKLWPSLFEIKLVPTQIRWP